MTLLAVVIALWMAPAGAHTALLRASPGPDETAGGSIKFIELAFLDPVTEAIVTVSYNGVPVEGSTIVADGEVIRFQLETALENPGRYQVFYEMTSFDSDYTTSGFFFTYAADAAQPARIDPPGEDSSFPLIPTAVGVTALVALLGVFVWRLDGQRRDPVHAEADHYLDDGYLDDQGYDDQGYDDQGYDEQSYDGDSETDW